MWRHVQMGGHKLTPRKKTEATQHFGGCRKSCACARFYFVGSPESPRVGTSSVLLFAVFTDSSVDAGLPIINLTVAEGWLWRVLRSLSFISPVASRCVFTARPPAGSWCFMSPATTLRRGTMLKLSKATLCLCLVAVFSGTCSLAESKGFGK